ncbi:hypothetical protein EJ05DRAFT_219648 [Pseudovirgaria hyperparasitica]|uniref:Wbp11/ELF5/Saf1 N-terminal domain-containing protein n=1 Tax=Pseudovirgaria hyperparasitica TaxID=470096 RepID=A0A6A6VTG2_9PEZI|nr:uncharacterized protein EJ05DRAFT_219648 [Pseudovirgaria hyperparasitica]KAF2753503.1 hypothetical protein EJ05DRAFT_219648 [Pseudovirgaria hyperparasitica]
MAKDKLSANPVQAQRKADKAKALKKGKAQLQTQRNEKLARRNPERLQRQIDDLRQAEATGSLRPKDRETLSQLEKDLRAVNKAREVLGDKAPHFRRHDSDDRGERGRGRGGRGGAVLGKRRRDGSRGSESSETDEDVRDIPMPRDTPPPVPRPNRNRHATGANQIEVESGIREPHALPAKPQIEAKTTYSAAPVVRDLRKEAVSKFIPSSVRNKPKVKTATKDTVEGDPEPVVEVAAEGVGHRAMIAEQNAIPHGTERDPNVGVVDLQAEEERFVREMRQVEMEEVLDEEL